MTRSRPILSSYISYPVWQGEDEESESEDSSSGKEEEEQPKPLISLLRKEEKEQLTEEQKKEKDRKREWRRAVMRRIGLFPPTLESILLCDQANHGKRRLRRFLKEMERNFDDLLALVLMNKKSG